MRSTLLSVAAGSLLLAAVLPSQSIAAPYNAWYAWTDLGSVPGLPTNYGGLVFKAGDPNTLLIGGAANQASAAVYEIGVTRDNNGFITGFSGTATQHSTAPNIDGGLFYGPNDVLFFTTYNNNHLGQIKLGSTTPDKMINLNNFGVGSSTGTGNFVPPNFSSAGQLKLLSYNQWTVHSFTVSPDGSGTYDITATGTPAVQITGGPEGYLYVPPGSTQIPDYSHVLVCEYGSGSVGLYQIDNNADPIPATRVNFLTGLSQIEGACTDPITGDLMFSTWGGGHRVVRVTGFGVCGSFTNYGTGVAGINGVPTIMGSGCAGRGQLMSIDVASGNPGALGLLAVGFSPTSVPVLNGTLLVNNLNNYFHLLDGSGNWNLPLVLPIDPIWNNLDIYSQAFYIDPVALHGFSATGGLHTNVR